MAKILAYDSSYMIRPLRILYLFFIKKFSNDTSKINELILYRLDQDNSFIRNSNNISGIPLGISQENLDAESIKFYKYLEELLQCNALKIKDISLFKLYKRQIKLKLSSLLRCAYRIKNTSDKNSYQLEVITDRQTKSIVLHALKFINYDENKIIFKTNEFLTLIICLNSMIMRVAAILNMLLTRSTLPNQYFHKHIEDSLPTILIALPRRRPLDFYQTYISELEGKFNILLYSHGFIDEVPDQYTRIKVNKRFGNIKGMFGVKGLMFTAQSYIFDLMIIFKYHSNLNISIDVVDQLFVNEIDVLINRQQTNVVDNYLTMKAKEKGIFVLGDLFEEIFFCNSLLLSSESQLTESVKLALTKNAKVTYKGSNSLIKYRLKNLSENSEKYLHNLLKLDESKKVIFYASEPSKEEGQRFQSERFLMKVFLDNPEFILVIKTHTQDNGRVTNYSYMSAGEPLNIILIGDIRQKDKIASKKFKLFEDFDFNAAIKSCDGFITSSSSSILQALLLKTKSAILDQYDNDYYKYLIDQKAALIIKNKLDVQRFLDHEELVTSEEVLNYCGLSNNYDDFDMSAHILSSYNEYKKNTKYRLDLN